MRIHDRIEVAFEAWGRFVVRHRFMVAGVCLLLSLGLPGRPAGRAGADGAGDTAAGAHGRNPYRGLTPYPADVIRETANEFFEVLEGVADSYLRGDE